MYSIEKKGQCVVVLVMLYHEVSEHLVSTNVSFLMIAKMLTINFFSLKPITLWVEIILKMKIKNVI